MCLCNSYKIYVSVKHNNLLHNIFLTAVSIILCNTYILYESKLDALRNKIQGR